MFLLQLVQTNAASTEPSACLNRLQRITLPQHTGTQTVELSSAMRPLGRPECEELYTAPCVRTGGDLESAQDKQSISPFRDTRPERRLLAPREYGLPARPSCQLLPRRRLLRLRRCSLPRLTHRRFQNSHTPCATDPENPTAGFDRFRCRSTFGCEFPAAVPVLRSLRPVLGASGASWLSWTAIFV